MRPSEATSCLWACKRPPPVQASMVRSLSRNLWAYLVIATVRLNHQFSLCVILLGWSMRFRTNVCALISLCAWWHRFFYALSSSDKYLCRPEIDWIQYGILLHNLSQYKDNIKAVMPHWFDQRQLFLITFVKVIKKSLPHISHCRYKYLLYLLRTG